MSLDIASVISGAWLTINVSPWFTIGRGGCFVTEDYASPIEIPPTGCEGSPAMNKWISQKVHNHPKTAREVGRSPYLVRRVERVLFIKSANSFILFPCRTMRAPCRIAPLTLPMILKFISPPLRCPQWDVTPLTYLQSWKTIFNKSDNMLSLISPVCMILKNEKPTSLIKSLKTNHKLIKGNRSHLKGGREISAILLTVAGDGWKDQKIYIGYNMVSKTWWFPQKKVFLVLFCSRRTAYYIVRDNARKITSVGLSYKGVILF